MHLITRPATISACHSMASRLRPEDEREVRTASGVRPSLALVAALKEAPESTYVFHLCNADGNVEEEPAVIFGVIHDGGSGGIPWMVCTSAIMRLGAQKALVKEGRFWIEAWLHRFTHLHNIIDSRNTSHLRWIRLMGFTLEGTAEIDGVPFHHFHQQQRPIESCVLPQQS